MNKRVSHICVTPFYCYKSQCLKSFYVTRVNINKEIPKLFDRRRSYLCRVFGKRKAPHFAISAHGNLKQKVSFATVGAVTCAESPTNGGLCKNFNLEQKVSFATEGVVTYGECSANGSLCPNFICIRGR